MAFQIQQVDQDSSKIFLLFDEVSGAMAKVAPSYGFNLFSLAFQINQKPISIITEPDRASELAKFPSRFGHPILFPFPNRISGGKFQWAGQDYEIPVSNGGNAIHGFAHTAEWRVVETSTNDESASITGEFQLSKDAPEHLRHWPTDAQIRLTYTLKNSELVIDADVSNPSDQVLPWGLGYHTYYNLPLTSDGDRQETSIQIPASRRWHLDKFIPTGQKEALPKDLDLRNGRPLKGLKADDVMTDLEHESDGQTRSYLKDLRLGYEVIISTDRHFSELVLFTPSWNANTIAIEPYTQTTDAVNLHQRGINGGLNQLQPKQSVHLSMRVAFRQI